MVACPKCVINNTLDSAFCKKCGAILPVAVIEEEQEKLKEIVSKGMESYQAGNLEEAMAIADHAILSNPSYGEAYALKGLVHERRAEYAEALDSYETVVALNPDSTIDKIKLNQLRNAFAARQAGEPKVDRKSAAFVGIATTLAVLAVGTVSYGIIQSSKENKQVQVTNTPLQVANNTAVDPRNMNIDTMGQANTDPNKPNPGNPGDVPALGADNNPPANTRPDTGERSNASRRRMGGDIIVDPENPGWNLSGPVNPVLPVGQSDQGTRKQPEPNDPPPKPKTDQGGDQDNKTTKVVEAPKDNGFIDVQLSPKGSGNGTSRNDSHSSSSAKNYQREGMNHMRSGKTAQARESLQKAIDAFQAEIDSGKGDKEAAQAGISSCRQALKNLKS